MAHDESGEQPDALDIDEGEHAAKPAKRRRRALWIVAPVLLVLAGGAAFVAKQVHDVYNAPYKTVSYTVPDAPHLVATSGEAVYRIDPSKSSLSYKIHENIAGRSVSSAEGSTHGIAGDLAVNRTEPSKSRIGSVVANIEQFHSDNRLRDARIRSDFLQSHTFPLATFTTTSIEGLPATLAEGASTKFTIKGTAKVHGVTHDVTWDATGTLHADGLDVTATTPIKLTDFGIEHVSIQGLVSASNDAVMTLKIHAVDPAKVAIPKTLSGPVQKASGPGPSFSKVVMPILEDHCSSCHQPGKVGAIHWQMKTAGDAAKVAEGVETVTEGALHAAVAGHEEGCAVGASQHPHQGPDRVDQRLGKGRRQARRPRIDGAQAGQDRPGDHAPRRQEAAHPGALHRSGRRGERLPLLRARPQDHPAHLPHRLRVRGRPGRGAAPRPGVPHLR